MNNTLRGCWIAGGLLALTALSHAQVVTFRATLNAAQETPPTSSPATGTAIMMYDVSKNTFDLVVHVDNFANPVTGSHVHEGLVGVGGSVVTSVGAESSYTRTGNSLDGTFHSLTYGGTPTTLLSGGSYFNIHSAQFPGGEIRGQLIAQKKRLFANINVAQAQATSSSTINSSAYGAAVMSFDPSTNTMHLRVNIFNFQNTFANSHFHEAPVGSSGGVVTAIGGASVYTSGGNGYYYGSFDLPYGGSVTKLLTGGAYLNFHSNVYPAGEIRGQVWPDEEIPGTRVINLSARGQVGSDVVILGFVVNGPEPVRVLITGKGPSLTAFGITTALSDPWLTLYDSGGRAIASNNDVGTVAAGSELASIPGVPTNPLESALVVALPPGNYCAILSGNNGATGTGLIEINDLRTINGIITSDE